MGCVSELLALPGQFTGLFIERDDSASGTAGCYHHAAGIHEWRFAPSPLGPFAAKIGGEILAPFFDSSLCIETDQLAELANGENQAAIQSGCAAWSFET